jgi:hypothetical protein
MARSRPTPCLTRGGARSGSLRRKYAICLSDARPQCGESRELIEHFWEVGAGLTPRSALAHPRLRRHRSMRGSAGSLHAHHDLAEVLRRSRAFERENLVDHGLQLASNDATDPTRTASEWLRRLALDQLPETPASCPWLRITKLRVFLDFAWGRPSSDSARTSAVRFVRAELSRRPKREVCACQSRTGARRCTCRRLAFA